MKLGNYPGPVAEISRLFIDMRGGDGARWLLSLKRVTYHETASG